MKAENFSNFWKTNHQYEGTWESYVYNERKSVFKLFFLVKFDLGSSFWE